MTTITSTTKATHIESLLSAEEQVRFDDILLAATETAAATENASRQWASFLTGLVVEHGTREAACRLGTAIARAKTATIRNNADGGDKAIDLAMSATDLATNWARKVLRAEYRYSLKLSKPKRNKVLAGGDEYRLLEVEELAEPRAHVVTAPKVSESIEPETAEPEADDGSVRIDPKDLDALLNLAVSVHGIEALTRAIMRRNGASPEIADKLASTLPAMIKKASGSRRAA